VDFLFVVVVVVVLLVCLGLINLLATLTCGAQKLIADWLIAATADAI